MPARCDSWTCHFTAEYANWKSGQFERLVILSVRLRLRPFAVPWSNGTTPARHAGNDGSTPSGITDVMVCRCFGGHRRDERWSAALVRRKIGFNSRTDLLVMRRMTPGLSSNGKTLEWHSSPVNQKTGRVQLPVGPLENNDWKVAGYGWPGRIANACSPRGMRVRIPRLPPLPRW